MTLAFFRSLGRTALVVALLSPAAARAQDPQASPTPLDQKAYERAVRDARRAAEQEEKTLRQAAEKERKDAESALKTREKTTAQLVAREAKGQDAGSTQSPSTPAPAAPALSKEEEKIRRAEEKAKAEAEKARQKEEERAKKQEAKDAEQRRKDEERAAREAAKAREQEEKERAKALSSGADRPEPPIDAVVPAAPTAAAPTPDLNPPPAVSKDEEKKRKELVKQIEKARDDRDQKNQKAEEAERIAAAARALANEAQRQYEALATGLSVEDVAPPPQPAAEPEKPKKSRFVTKADVLEAVAEKAAPVAAAPDPLRIALELKSAEAEEREKAAFALAQLGPDAQPATRALMAALADPNPAVRVAAAQALGRIGPGASLAIAPLSAALTDPDPAVKNAAQAALLSIRAR